MEKETTILEEQSWLDIAIQAGGSLESAISIAMANNISITDQPAVGQKIANPATINNQATGYYAKRSLTPATGLIDNPGGIGYMGIGIDFMIN